MRQLLSEQQLTSRLSILLANSCAANPPNTTEWMAPILAQPYIAISACQVNKMYQYIDEKKIHLGSMYCYHILCYFATRSSNESIFRVPICTAML